MKYIKMKEIAQAYQLSGMKLKKSQPLPGVKIGDHVSVYFNKNAIKVALYGTWTTKAQTEKLLKTYSQEIVNRYGSGSIYSIKKGSKVIDHQRRVCIRDAKFIIWKGVLKKIREKKSQDVCCFVRGSYQGSLSKELQLDIMKKWYGSQKEMQKEGWFRVVFNPFVHNTFMYVNKSGKLIPLQSGSVVVMMSDEKSKPSMGYASFILVRYPNGRYK